jgi:hypothetical protein
MGPEWCTVGQNFHTCSINCLSGSTQDLHQSNRGVRRLQSERLRAADNPEFLQFGYISRYGSIKTDISLFHQFQCGDLLDDR